MKQIINVAILANLAALAVVVAVWGGGARFHAFAAGLGLFDVNLWLIWYGASRMFAASIPLGDSGKPRRVSPLFLPAMFLKVMLLGGGAYVALAIAGCDALFFIAGLVSGLALFVLPSIVLRRYFLLSTTAKVS